MQLKETKETLNKFGKYVIQQARTNLTKRKMNVSKSLYNSLDYKMFKGSNAIGINFIMDDYGKFQDKGVSGTKKKYNTPYSYTTKMPPPSAFSQWVVRKGLEGTRDKKTGKFLSRKSLQYAVAKNIFKYGIKPSMFFTKPFNAAFKRLPDDLQNAFADDLDNSIIIPNNNK
tara:strand:+ start:382 stop:894 length:513 start_codon:yes stop_codon:yes gene_type:complete